MSEELKKIIIDHVANDPGVKGTALASLSLDTFYSKKSKEISGDKAFCSVTDFTETLNSLVQDGELVEVEYVLPTMDYRIKSTYFPKGTMVRQQTGDPRATRAYLGDEAKKEFHRALDAAFSDDAIGGVYAYTRRGPNKPITIDRIGDIEGAMVQGSSNMHEMIVIDSGNRFGDSWKFVYHPLTCSAVFFSEAPDLVLRR